jgi:succinate dehydrogenase / fumarate reductase iron-sulfur subunit
LDPDGRKKLSAMAASDNEEQKVKSINVRVLRQDGPGQTNYWEEYAVPYEPNMNVISVLQRMAAIATTADGKAVAPIVWRCNCLEEVCGSCTMVINGRVRQACSALVDKLLEERPEGIELRPMSKFPVVRDLMVDRDRLFRALKKSQSWIPVDGYYDTGPGPRQSPVTQEQLYPLSKCMSCGCCLEACPQYVLVDVTRQPDESDDEFEARKAQVYDQHFLGAHAINQTVLFNSHPTGQHHSDQRLDALISEGGIQNCGNAQNCVAVCPKEIPLTTSIARAGRAATKHSIKKWLEE